MGQLYHAAHPFLWWWTILIFYLFIKGDKLINNNTLADTKANELPH